MAVLVAGLVAGIWFLVFDMFLLEPLMGSLMANIPGLNPTPPMLWMVVGDLAAGLVLAAVYARVRSVFGTGFANGATYGVYAGVLMNFPIWLQMSVYVSWPYVTAWAFTIMGIVICAVAGGLVGVVFPKLSGATSGA